jgi:hypothetical protein
MLTILNHLLRIVYANDSVWDTHAVERLHARFNAVNVRQAIQRDVTR